MLIPFSRYRRRHAVGVFVSMFILNTLLMLGLATKTHVTPVELSFAVAAIVTAVSYIGIRDTASHLAYAVESPKFYRDEADFELLKRYATGWRKISFVLARPIYPAILMGIVFTSLQVLLGFLLPVSGLLITGALIVALYPLTLSRLIYFLAPILVGWKEIEASRGRAKSGNTISLRRLIRTIVTTDLLVTALITVALVLPVRHSLAFQPALGYNSTEFILAALILVMIVLALSLPSAWRTRPQVCSGELYRRVGIDFAQPLSGPPTGSRWRRGLRYSLILWSLTIVTCLMLGAFYPAAPIQLVLALLLLPLAPIFWIERAATLSVNFRDAAQLLTEFPPRSLSPELVGAT